MKKVLLATDGSSCAEEAAWFLSHLPHGEKLDLYVLTVLQIPYPGQRYLSPSAVSESVDRERALAEKAYRADQGDVRRSECRDTAHFPRGSSRPIDCRCS